VRQEERKIDRTPGRLVVAALISLYAGIGCFMFGAVLVAFVGPGGALLFGLSQIVVVPCLPLILLAIIVKLSEPPTHRARDTSASGSEADE
jgi:hypothetical protein